MEVKSVDFPEVYNEDGIYNGYASARKWSGLTRTEFGKLFGYGKNAYNVVYEKEVGKRKVTRSDDQIIIYIEFLIEAHGVTRKNTRNFFEISEKCRNVNSVL